MMTDDVLKATALRAYERSRVRFALAVAVPLSLLPLTSFALGTPARSAALLGAGLVTLAAVCLWRGGGPRRGVVAGLKAGLVPLALAHAANLAGHVCTPGGCMSLCVPACAAGGVIAGAVVEHLARTGPHPTWTRALGLGGAVLTGALGCACVGASGVLALVAGAAASALASRLGAGSRVICGASFDAGGASFEYVARACPPGCRPCSA